MKVLVFDTAGMRAGEKDLPAQFNEQPRRDIIRRAVLAIFSTERSPYGAFPRAGKRPSGDLSKRRRHYRGSYGYGISRVPRKILSRSGTRFNWVGAFMPGVVGGRRAHPPKAEKIYAEKINTKERRRAIRSALAATMQRSLVAQRGHLVSDNYPFILSNQFERLAKTKELRVALEKLKLDRELDRVLETKVRAGKAKMRNRRYRRSVGPLIVVARECPLTKSSRNLNISVVPVKNLNAKVLAPGTVPGRLTLFTEAALDVLAQEKLFM